MILMIALLNDSLKRFFQRSFIIKFQVGHGKIPFSNLFEYLFRVNALQHHDCGLSL